MTYSDTEDDLIKSAYNENLPGVEAALGAKVRQGVRLRALYISAREGYTEIFQRLLKGPGDDYSGAWENFQRENVSPIPFQQKLEFLLSKFQINDVYIRDRDGQCLVHHVAKDGREDNFEWMIDQKYYNPLVRDHEGRTAWDIAKTTPRIDWVFKYILKAYELLSPRSTGSDILKIIHFVSDKEPSDDLRFTPTQFFDDSTSDSQWEKSTYQAAKRAVKGSSELIWVNMDVNDDALFTAIISKICKWKDYREPDIAKMLKFHANTFFEQKQDDPWLNFREPSYNTTRINVSHRKGDVKVTSITFPYFDGGDLYAGETFLKSYFHKVNGSTPSPEQISKWSTNVHVQRNLDMSYFVGLNTTQLKMRERKTLSEKLHAITNEHLLIPQLWLWSFENVLITASPREKPRKSHLFDHTLSRLRDAGSAAREGMKIDHLAVGLLSECVHRLDPPCMADRSDPFLSWLGNRIAETSDKVDQYMTNTSIENMKIKTEQGYIETIGMLRGYLPKLKNIIIQQQRVWDLQAVDFKDKAENASNQETVGRIRGITRRPDTDFASFHDRIRRLGEDAEFVEKYILAELDLKSKHASLRTSRYSTVIGLLAFTFAVVTIIFTPLSFLTSLLALPVTRFQDHQFNHTSSASGNTVVAYKSGKLGGWMAAVEFASFGVTLSCLGLAWLWYHKHEHLSSGSSESKSLNNEQQRSLVGTPADPSIYFNGWIKRIRHKDSKSDPESSGGH